MNYAFLTTFKRSGKLSLHEEVASFLQTCIRDGRLGPGEQIPSLREMEKLLSVNYCSLKLATSRLVELGLVYKKQGMGTFVTPQLNSSRVTRPHRPIHVILYEANCNELPGNISYTVLLREYVTTLLRNAHAEVSLVKDERPASEHNRAPQQIISAIASGSVDALVALQLNAADKKWFQPLALPKITGMQIITPDFEQVAAELLRRKCRRIAMIVPSEKKRSGSSLVSHFEEAGIHIASSRLALLDYENELSGKLWGQLGYEAAMRLLDLPASRRPDALIVYPDGAVVGAIQAILQLGIEPASMLPVFHRNVELAYFCPFHAYYMDISIQEAARKIVQTLLNERIDG